MLETLSTLGITSSFKKTDDMITHVLFTDQNDKLLVHKLAEPAISKEYAVRVAAGTCLANLLSIDQRTIDAIIEEL